MKTTMGLALTAVANAIAEQEFAFIKFIAEYGKQYATLDQYNHRLEQFARTYAEIVKHNSEEHQFTLAVNEFSDWT